MKISESSPGSVEVADPTATRRALDALRVLILRQALLPGQQVRQQDLSLQLGLSRTPVREALRALESEGLLRYRANYGYFVTRLNSDELTEVYLMRRLLEGEVLKTVRQPSADELRELDATNESLRLAIVDQSVAQMLVANRRFHFQVFQLSDLHVVVREIEGLWHLSEPYRATYLWNTESRERIVREHAAMITALASSRRDEVVEIADQHRSSAERSVVSMLFAQENQMS